MKKAAITIHQNELEETGVKVWRVNEPVKGRAQLAHRDDHYVFIIQREGHLVCELDFNRVTLSGSSLCYIAPGQVHRYIDLQSPDSWFVFVEPGLVPEQCREVFNACSNARQTAVIAAIDPVFLLLPVLESALAAQITSLQKTLTGSLVAALSSIIAEKLLSFQQENPVNNQQYQLVNRFKQLLSEKFHEIKQVQAYAVLLNITPLYLNEVVKTVTGFTASYWINQQVLLEAKRLLYYTALDVKQVAFELGYDDHAYFSRFFKKHTGLTALAFRAGKP